MLMLITMLDNIDMGSPQGKVVTRERIQNCVAIVAHTRIVGSYHMLTPSCASEENKTDGMPLPGEDTQGRLAVHRPKTIVSCWQGRCADTVLR